MQNSKDSLAASSTCAQKWTNPFVANGRAGPPTQNTTSSRVAPSATAKKWTNPVVASGRVGPAKQKSANSLQASTSIAQKWINDPLRVHACACRCRIQRILELRRLPLCSSGQPPSWRVDGWTRQCRIRRFLLLRRLSLWRSGRIILWGMDAWARNAGFDELCCGVACRCVEVDKSTCGEWARAPPPCRIQRVLLRRRLLLAQRGLKFLLACGRVGKPMQKSTDSLVASSERGEWTRPLVASGRVGPPMQNSTNSRVAMSATREKFINPFVARARVGPPMWNLTSSLVASSSIVQK